MKPPAQAAVPSPCTDVCEMDDAVGLCKGCMRTLGEIATWSQMSDADKRALLLLLPQRRVSWPGSPDAAVPKAPT